MYEALNAALQCAMASWSDPGPGVPTFTGELGSRLRLDDQRITYRNPLDPLGRTHRIGWDQVRWLRDGARTNDHADAGYWMLCIVLHNGRVIKAEATEEAQPARPSMLAAIRQAAARHAVPVVLTGEAAKRGRPHKAGLYVDPGGKLGLREWTGTEWSPDLWVDPASIGHDAGTSPVRVWSPLPDPEQQRQWDAAASRARRAGIGFAAWLGATATAAAVTLGMFAYDLSQPKADLSWAIPVLIFLVYGAIFTFRAWRNREDRRTAAQAAKRAAELARSEDSTPSVLDDRGGGPSAGAPVTSQPPAADPAAGAGRISCRECGADSDRATQVCTRCGAPLLPLRSP
jgi:hypothetical protein